MTNDLYKKVSEFCEPIMRDRDAIFTAASLTTAFIEQQFNSEWPRGPSDMSAAIYIGVQQIVRPLARRHAKEFDDTQVDLNLPEDQLLQDRYSVPSGRDEQGEIFKYVPRHRLTAEDVQLICARARALSQYWIRYADALESWFNRSQSGTG